MRTAGWTQEQALILCVEFEKIAPKHGGHIALTGGTLYKEGVRKDLDILVYPIRGKCFDWDGFFDEIEAVLGVNLDGDFGWCKKASYKGWHIDFFDPLAPAGNHTSGAVPEEGWLS